MAAFALLPRGQASGVTMLWKEARIHFTLSAQLVKRLLSCCPDPPIPSQTGLFKDQEGLSKDTCKEFQNNPSTASCREDRQNTGSLSESITVQEDSKHNRGLQKSVTSPLVEPDCLPLVVLPLKLRESMKSLLSNYPNKSLKEDGEVLQHNLTNRNPPLSRIVPRTDAPSSSSPSSSSPPSSSSSVSSSSESIDERTNEELEEDEIDEMDKLLKRNFSLKSKRTKLSKYSPMRYGKREAVAYVAARMNGTYASTYRVLQEISSRCPDFHPGTLLDFGSGVGSTIWAANELWGNSLYEHQCVDVSEDMEKVARALRSEGDDPEVSESAIPNVHFKQYLPVSNTVMYDLVVSAYSLSDVPTISLRKSTVRSLWNKADQFLVLIEMGNHAGFSIISEARNMILHGSGDHNDGELPGSEGHVFAPCPHEHACPLLKERKTCHFAQRSQIISGQVTRDRKIGFHIEKFSYLVMRKGPRTQPEALSRILQPVKKRSRHLICNACSPDGQAKNQVISKGKWGTIYRELRSAKWGDRAEIPSGHPEVSAE